MIPERPAVDTESNAELRLFDRLRDETPDDIVAFHNVAWLVPGKSGRPRRGESDFILAHPDHGVVTLEVKGGSIRYDATAGEWLSVGKEGEKGIKDPVRQCERASYLLRDALARAKRGWRPSADVRPRGRLPLARPVPAVASPTWRIYGFQRAIGDAAG
jgi:hypothetical protein